MAAAKPDACFHIISKDKGYDPLLKHLKGRGIEVARSETIPAKFFPKAPKASVINGKNAPKQATPQKLPFEIIINNLRNQRQARPRTLAKLTNAIGALFQKQMKANEIDGLVDQLKQSGHIVLDAQNKVTYNLPKGKAPVKG